jgi:anti-sigma regulatory factor (Ser/Thr protein kinase)
VDAALLPTIDLVVEELFTNMVKYSPESIAEVDVRLERIDGGVEVTLTDHDVEPFDVTQRPEVNVDLPIEQRKPGGLGLHLIRRLTDSVEYRYSSEDRQSRIIIRKTQPGPPPTGNDPKAGKQDAGN